MILVITGKRDGHVPAVTKHFERVGEPWTRINIEDFATNVEVEISPARGVKRLWVRDSRREIDLYRVKAVWYRKPDPIRLDHFELDQAALDYIEAEFNEVISGIYALMDHAYWINNPFSTRLAHRKLAQLAVAARAGFLVPDSLLTNKADAAVEFGRSIGGDIAIKSLGAISVTQGEDAGSLQYGIFTRRIDERDLADHREKIGYMPTLFQRFVEKDSELRVTYVNGQLFVCDIRPRDGDITSEDYRFDTQSLKHSAIECPSSILRPIHNYMKSFGLDFGCFDFIVSKKGQIVFLEMNCNGQWLWVEDKTGLSIAAAIASTLMAKGQAVGNRLVAGLNEARQVAKKDMGQ